MADKGLKSNVVGLFGGTILGVSRWLRRTRSSAAIRSNMSLRTKCARTSIWCRDDSLRPAIRPGLHLSRCPSATSTTKQLRRRRCGDLGAPFDGGTSIGPVPASAASHPDDRLPAARRIAASLALRTDGLQT
jgi:hypothetical protein